MPRAPRGRRVTDTETGSFLVMGRAAKGRAEPFFEHSTRNARSGRVAIRAGFVSEGIRRGSNLHGDGWHDMHLYSHLSTDQPANAMRNP